MRRLLLLSLFASSILSTGTFTVSLRGSTLPLLPKAPLFFLRGNMKRPGPARSMEWGFHREWHVLTDRYCGRCSLDVPKGQDKYGDVGLWTAVEHRFPPSNPPTVHPPFLPPLLLAVAVCKTGLDSSPSNLCSRSVYQQHRPGRQQPVEHPPLPGSVFGKWIPDSHSPRSHQSSLTTACIAHPASHSEPSRFPADSWHLAENFCMVPVRHAQHAHGLV